ncbi:hypothetical protein SLEP1_g40508 [Rubroshorea leprosula]|uniref:Uncharacterized protein n=1 Tax=Rubroshorea leprosula TaxID=152421 RepID=A0AAV5L467_9ROSI|nr:hypothetical protein SLEP1_g40508 [Rubroshorea leprosula]
MRTEDVQIISCRQWKSNSQRRGKHLGGRKLNPVLLLNGHSTESYYLSIEPNDLVRTLLEEGLEIHICNSGFIVDSSGKYSYLIHPERMALSTLYVSGVRSLVTPETSFLANKYMKLHQPGFRHERVVVEGFGHSDLLIGEESHAKAFPHILSHIRLAEQGKNSMTNSEGKAYSREAPEYHSNCVHFQ